MDINLNLTSNQLIESNGDYEIVQGENGLDIQPMDTSETRITTTNVRLMEVDKPPTLPSNIGKKINGTFKINIPQTINPYKQPIVTKIVVGPSDTNKSAMLSSFTYTSDAEIPVTLKSEDLLVMITSPVLGYCTVEVNYYLKSNQTTTFNVGKYRYYYLFQNVWVTDNHVKIMGTIHDSNEEKKLLTIRDTNENGDEYTSVRIDNDVLLFSFPDN